MRNHNMCKVASYMSLTLIVCGCDAFNSDALLRNQLIGSWRTYDETYGSSIFIFRADGTCTQRTGGNFIGSVLQTINGDFHGTWYVKDGSCYMEYESSDGLGWLGIVGSQAIVGGPAVFRMKITKINSREIQTEIGSSFVRISD